MGKIAESKRKTFFVVYGPYEIPVNKQKYGRRISKEFVEEFGFWNENEMGDDRGCYVFAMRTKSYTPYYVGKTSKMFQQECFTADKETKYNHVLADRRGTPVMFFLSPQNSKRPPTNMIADLEYFLIQNAFSVNPELLNSQGKNEQKWAIGGVIRGGKGSSSTDSRKFKEMMEF